MLAAWLVAWLAVCLQGAIGVFMPSQSFHTGPTDVSALAPYWYMTGTAIPSKNAVILQPGVPDRVGALWSKSPIPSNDFEVKVQFSVTAPASTFATHQGFAIWYVYEGHTELERLGKDHICNQAEILANTWQDHCRQAGMDLVAYRSKFNGLGLFFVNTGDGPSVSAVFNKGDSEVFYKHKVPFPNARKVGNYLDGKKLTVSLRFKPDSVKVEFTGSLSYSWELPAEIRHGGYLGLTAHGGDKSTADAKEKSNLIQIHDLSTDNFDASYKGEDATTLPPVPTKSPEEREDVLHESSSFKDHRAESDAIKELTNTVFKLVMETQPMRAQMDHAIKSLTKKIETMEAVFQSFKDELDKKTGHHLVAEFDSIKQELSSLSATASEQHKARQDRLDLLHEDVSQVHKAAHAPDGLDHHLNQLTASHQRTLDQLTTEHQRMFGVSLSAIAFVLVAGLSLYNKFRCWEKKHVL